MNDETVHLGYFSTALEAHFARGLLTQRGIDAFVDGEAMGTVWGFPIGMGEGIRLSVRREDLEAATAVLEEPPGPVPDSGAHPGPADFDISSIALAASDAPPLVDTTGDWGYWARRVRAFSVVLIPAGVISTVPFATPILTVILLVLLCSSRAREETSPAGRRYLRHAWTALTIVAGLQIAPVVYVALGLLSPHLRP